MTAATDARITGPGVIPVKAGRNIGVAMLRDLRGVMERDRYELGLFLSAYEPTGPMKAEAAAGKFESRTGYDADREGRRVRARMDITAACRPRYS